MVSGNPRPQMYLFCGAGGILILYTFSFCVYHNRYIFRVLCRYSVYYSACKFFFMLYSTNVYLFFFFILIKYTFCVIYTHTVIVYIFIMWSTRWNKVHYTRIKIDMHYEFNKQLSTDGFSFPVCYFFCEFIFLFAV